jgi:hypothetical protein
MYDIAVGANNFDGILGDVDASVTRNEVSIGLRD